MPAKDSEKSPDLFTRGFEARDQTQETAVRSVRAELELAATFVSVAEAASNSQTALRNIQNAWRALKTVGEFAGKLGLESAERQLVLDAHGALCLRLAHLQARLLGD